MKKLFSLLTIALLALTAGAKVVTINFGAIYGSTDSTLTELTVDGITLTFAKNGGTAPKYYANGTAVRIYKSNTMTVAAEEGYTITQIDFTYNGSTWLQNPSNADVGTVNNQGDWIGEANPIVFTNNREGTGSGAQVRIQSMSITVLGGETPENKVADPIFNPAGGNFPAGTSQEVTVECATENASIYLFKVTEDGEEYVDFFFPPTGGGYTQGTFYVTESGKYAAIAYKNGMEDSDTTFATFNFYKPTCAKPTFTPANGTSFLEGEMITVTINCATEGATITYTVNDDISEGIAPVSVPVDQTTTITAIASKEGYNNSDQATATYTMVAPVEEGPIFTLVTNLNDLAAGDHIIFVNKKEDGAAVAMAGKNNNNNFASVNVAVRNGQVQTNQANIITLEANDDFWNFKTTQGYLYAPGGGNYLRLEDEVDANANAAITIGADTTIIKFQGSGDQKYLRSNPNNGTPLFSCYAEGSSIKGLVYIYKTTEEIVEVAAPEITPASNTTFVGSQEVTITCATTGATIYYSFDEENWTKYEAPFTINESCTVYAYAKLGDAQSTIVSAKYYKANTVQNIAEALALQEGNVDFMFTGEAIVTYQNGKNTWIKDATGYGLIYGDGVPAMTTGTVISDGWTAYLTVYYGVPEFASPKNVEASEDVVTVEPEVKETVTNDDVNMYLKMEDQTLTATVNKTWANADGLLFYDKFGVNPTIEEGKTYDVVGIATIFNDAPEVYIINVTEHQDTPAGLRGDVNLDEQVNIQDVTALINYILSKNADGISLENANCNEDDQINIQDVTTLINYILSKHW